MPGAPQMPPMGGFGAPIGAPRPVQYGAPGQPVRQYGAPGQPVVKQAQQQPAPQPEEKITVNITGREGVNDVINGTYTSCGEHGGRYCFYAPTNEVPIYLSSTRRRTTGASATRLARSPTTRSAARRTGKTWPRSGGSGPATRGRTTRRSTPRSSERPRSATGWARPGTQARLGHPFWARPSVRTRGAPSAAAPSHGQAAGSKGPSKRVVGFRPSGAGARPPRNRGASPRADL